MIGKIILVIYILSILLSMVSFMSYNCCINQRTRRWKRKVRESSTEKRLDFIRMVLTILVISLIPVINVGVSFTLANPGYIDSVIDQHKDEYFTDDD